MEENKKNYEVFEVAYGKGKFKKWALERVIIDTLYKTTNEDMLYIKTNNINCFGKADEENAEEYIYKYGYLFRIPKTEIDLIVRKKDGKLILKKVGLGFGYDNVEEEIFKVIYQKIKNKNIYFHTNCNLSGDYLIK